MNKPPPCIGDLEQRFKEAISRLPQYKREDCFEYVNALRMRILELEKENDDLGNQLADELNGQ